MEENAPITLPLSTTASQHGILGKNKDAITRRVGMSPLFSSVSSPGHQPSTLLPSHHYDPNKGIAQPAGVVSLRLRPGIQPSFSSPSQRACPTHSGTYLWGMKCWRGGRWWVGWNRYWEWAATVWRAGGACRESAVTAREDNHHRTSLAYGL